MPAGTVHAIGSGVTLLEVQNRSGITYRLWDWNRLDSHNKPRELHLDEGLAVVKYGREYNNSKHFRYQKNLFEEDRNFLVQNDSFTVHFSCINTGEQKTVPLEPQIVRAKSVICLDGQITIQRGNDSIELNAFESCLLPSSGEYVIILTAQHLSHAVIVE